jgi:DNA-binding CsgD family transcriptional regulator
MAHALSTVIAEPILQLWTGIALYQSDANRPFTEQARADMQELVPHLSEAWNISRFALMDPSRDNAMSARYGRAICDRQGVLYNADQNFADLLLEEWPDWRGPRLPQELLEMVPAVGKRPYIGRHIAVSSETVHNMKRLSVRRRTVVDTLSAREHEVAALFATGANFRSTADSLHIAPVTVRNHLRQVYAKLGITNKLELARLMRQE